MTKTVHKDEVGKIFSVVALIGAATPVAAETLFKKLYAATLDIYSGAFLLLAG